MSTQRLGIVMHGVTGRMGMNQHLIRSILEIRRQGGVALKDGTRLTNARAAKMAKDAIKQAVGRPSLTAKSVESPQIKVRVPVKLKKALDKEAKRRGETNSAIVREALEKYLKSA